MTTTSNPLQKDQAVTADLQRLTGQYESTLLGLTDWCGIEPDRPPERIVPALCDWFQELDTIGLPTMRLVVPWLMDLAALIRVPHPSIRNGSNGNNQRYTDGGYLDRFLIPLSNQTAIRFLSQRFQQAEQGQARMIARFVQCLAGWTVQALESHEGARWLFDDLHLGPVTDTKELQSFFQLLAGLSEQHIELDRAVPPLDQFLIAMMSEVEKADEKANRQLILECLESEELHEEDVRPRAVVPVFGEWFNLSRNPGKHVTIQRVRKTTDMQLIREVVPHELAVLRTANGRQHFLDKIANEGILIHERQHFTDHERTYRVLLCVTAAIGETVNTQATAFYLSPVVRGEQAGQVASGTWGDAGGGLNGQPTVEMGSSSDTRVRTFVFDVIRDLTRLVNDPELHVDVRIFLDCAGDARLNRMWRGSLEELRRSLLGSRYEFMMEIESRIPGYFLERPVERCLADEPSRAFIERISAGASGYDRMVFAFVGSHRSLDGLVPHGLTAQRGQRDSVPATVFRIQVGTADRHVEVATAVPRGRDQLQWQFRFQPDEECRQSLVEATAGSLDSTEHDGRVGAREVFVR